MLAYSHDNRYIACNTRGVCPANLILYLKGIKKGEAGFNPHSPL
ncbi:hypothetical protein C1G86_1625 [Dehalococcoides mccartyi]|uniref:Uncharacterized protein n=1 Tax=Dehalococcoides mccartyi TaxID=61435 RepID=A0A142VDE1_9CHLR|nr:hypothetical protein X794_07030 [Dehalococcoides mccartyi CG5]AMU87337.1 hypothetical protein Dm11a5_1511 [Dehalococcoides mccartyi]AOV99984.1 hypothetical protein DCWBC2_1376 [Dehalococcoides mccartyi]MBA2084323.1 hypothetical protein [Dehalococcoides mccartyi]RAL69875.1 hypothetical protein C1G87_0008 [Dehalococcoides mccartyi]